RSASRRMPTLPLVSHLLPLHERSCTSRHWSWPGYRESEQSQMWRKGAAFAAPPSSTRERREAERTLLRVLHGTETGGLTVLSIKSGQVHLDLTRFDGDIKLG